MFLCNVKVKEATHSIVSGDSSPTLFSEVFGESYRSASGAVTESEYIFLRNGLFRHIELLKSIAPSDQAIIDGTVLQTHTIRILEYGFGTGLNALVTAAAADRGEIPEGTNIEYTSLDLYPLDEQQCSALRYKIDCPCGCDALLRKIHTAEWSSPTDTVQNFHKILPNFSLRKLKVDFTEYNPLKDNAFRAPWIDVVYFDPFSPECEPECWSEAIFSHISTAMRPCAVLSTYSAKGDVKRALRAANLFVRRIPGTGCKRHNLVATK